MLWFLQRNRNNRMCEYTEEFYYKEWLHVILDYGKSKICIFRPTDSRPRRSNGADRDWRQSIEVLLAWEPDLFVPLRSSPDCMSLLYLLCSEFANLNANFIQKDPPSWHMKLPSQGYIMFIALIVVIVSWVHTHVLTYPTVYLKYLQFIVCQIHLNKTIKMLMRNTW